MTLRKALILLRLNSFESEYFFKKHPEIGIKPDFQENLENEISNEQFFSMFTLSNDEHLDQGVCWFIGHYDNFKLKPFLDRGASPFGYINQRNNNTKIPKGISISETNGNWKIRIRIGMILKCKYDDNYGLLLAQTSNRRGREQLKDNRVLYFEKKLNFFIPKYILVAYIEDLNDSNKCYDVTNISEFENIGGEDAMRQGIPYFSENHTIGIPHIFTPEKILYYYSVSDDIWLYHKYLYLNTLNSLSIPDKIRIAEKIDEIRNYVNTFDFLSVIETYQIHKSGYLQRRCGRDDHFNMTTYKTIDSKDIYIKSIVPLGVEKSYTLGSSSDEGYDILDTDEMNRVIAKAKQEYTTTKHFDFLRDDYMSSIIFINREKELTKNSIEYHFNIHKTLSELKTTNSENYEEIIKEYNLEYSNIKQLNELDY